MFAKSHSKLFVFLMLAVILSACLPDAPYTPTPAPDVTITPSAPAPSATALPIRTPAPGGTEPYIPTVIPGLEGDMNRGEVAPLLVPVYIAGTGKIPPVVNCPFLDIGDLPQDQHDSICQLWGLGVTVGTVRDKYYSPALPFGDSARQYLINLGAAIERDK